MIRLREAAVVTAVVLFSVASALAQSPEISFDIPAQPLDAALEAYTRATGLQVLYRNALTVSRTSAAVSGRFTPQAALDRLLSGTNLAARYTTESAFTLIAVTVAEKTVLEYDVFLGGVQQRIVASLCGGSTTRPGDYRVALQFSIGPTGALYGTSLLGSSGDHVRDQAIAAALTGLVVGHGPPVDMPQPVTMLIRPGRVGGESDCRRYDRPSGERARAAEPGRG
jgi:hypothetical protein